VFETYFGRVGIVVFEAIEEEEFMADLGGFLNEGIDKHEDFHDHFWVVAELCKD
jgi:hypothetical protein